MELDTRIGTARMVPGADSVTAYADDGTGGACVAWGGTTPAVLMHLAPDGTRTPGPELPFTPTDFTWMDGELVIAGGHTRIAVGDPTTGAWRFVGAAGPVFRFAPGQERTVLAEVERAESEFGMPANLWLIPVPR